MDFGVAGVIVDSAVAGVVADPGLPAVHWKVILKRI